MRSAFAALISVCALAACNPSGCSGGNTAGPNAGGGLFPDLTRTAYRAEATIFDADGNTTPIVMIRDGGNMRMEINAEEGASTIITNTDSNDTYVITTQGGQTMALRTSAISQGFTNPIEHWQGELAQDATRTGSCSVAGENGAEWTKTTEADGTDTVCVTDDGIILRATDDGRVAWETTSVQRGAQRADLFTLPEGAQVMDLGNMGGMLNDAIEAAKQRGD